MTTLTDSGQGMDVAIGGLGFRLAINKERPYERATAQFRKEQFDSAPTVGDQSLTGMWTRGQLSFHAGGGTKYYEVLDGEEVLNTFWRNSNTVVSEPGKVTLGYETAELTVTTPVDSVSVYNGILAERWRVMLDATGALTRTLDGTTLSTQTPLALATSDAAAATSITASDNQLWLTNGNKIEYWTAGVGAASIVVYTLTDAGATWTKVWYLKGRLWAVDSNHKWYMLAASTTPASVSAAIDSFSTTPSGSTLEPYCAIDTPDSVMIGRDNYVYRVTIDSSGVVPVPGQLVEAAILPPHEAVKCLGYALGTLAICTLYGVRFATVSTEGVVYGPAVAKEVDFSKASRVAVKKSMMYIPGIDITEEFKAFIYAFDLSQNSDLTLPWSREYELSLPDGSWKLGCWSGRYGLEFWSRTTGKLYRTDDETFIYSSRSLHQPSGYVQTGMHRLGTLEPKTFASVRVRADGDGGTITTYLVEQNGTETSLGTITLPGQTGMEVNLNMAAPAEAIALKFALARDATDDTVGPELLGYQIKALPAPQRQRMIRVPLLCMDEESRGGTPATGYDGSAYDRLTALETMEASGGFHDYQDFRTGETGTVFIESIEHRGTNPPGPQGDGYGGIVWVTMRKIA